MSASGEIKEEDFRIKRWKWLVYYLGCTFLSVFGGLWLLLEPFSFFGLDKWFNRLGWCGYLSLAFISFVIATIVTGFKISGDVKKLEKQSSLDRIEQHATKKPHHILECELKPISRNIKTLVASILELPDILDFLRDNKFCRLCERHDFNKEWQLIKKLVNRRSHSYYIEDTFYNFINTLYLMGNDFLQEFFEDFQKRYKEEHPSADFTQIESELKNLEKVSQPKHREKVREEYNQMLTERKLFE